MNNLNLSPAEEQAFSQKLQNKQLLVMIKRFNAMTQQCFEACVDDFTSKSLGSREESCINRCFEKMNNAETRAGSRFQEHMAAMNASNSLNN